MKIISTKAIKVNDMSSVFCTNNAKIESGSRYDSKGRLKILVSSLTRHLLRTHVYNALRTHELTYTVTFTLTTKLKQLTFLPAVRNL